MFTEAGLFPLKTCDVIDALPHLVWHSTEVVA